MNALFNKGYIDSICNKATIQHYTKEKLLLTPIVIPSITEQDKIISYLDKKSVEIDKIIEEKQSLLTDLESYKKSLIYEVVTGKRKVC